METFLVRNWSKEPVLLLEAADSIDAELYATRQLEGVSPRLERVTAGAYDPALPVRRVPHQEATSTILRRRQGLSRADVERKFSAMKGGRLMTVRESQDELAQAFQGLGLNPREARRAALGREATAGGLDGSSIGSMIDAPSSWEERGFTSKDFAIGGADPADWFGPLTQTPGGKPDIASVASAYELLFDSSGSPRGRARDLSDADVAAVKARLSTAWDQAAKNGVGAASTMPKPEGLGGPKPGTASARRHIDPNFEDEMRAAGRALGFESRVGLEAFVEGRGEVHHG